MYSTYTYYIAVSFMHVYYSYVTVTHTILLSLIVQNTCVFILNIARIVGRKQSITTVTDTLNM